MEGTQWEKKKYIESLIICIIAFQMHFIKQKLINLV